VAAGGERGPAVLESVLGATPQEFESLILRQSRPTGPAVRDAGRPGHGPGYGFLATAGVCAGRAFACALRSAAAFAAAALAAAALAAAASALAAAWAS
jgi:hypothetical protein